MKGIAHRGFVTFDVIDQRYFSALMCNEVGAVGDALVVKLNLVMLSLHFALACGRTCDGVAMEMLLIV